MRPRRGPPPPACRPPRRLPALLRALALFGAAAGLGACTPLALVTTIGATAGSMALTEQGFTRAATDTGIALAINQAWFARDAELFRRLGTSVSDGRVLLTGTVARPEDRVEAVRIAWSVEGVREVISEIQVSDERGLADAVRDRVITTGLRAALTLDAGVRSINYSIDTVNGVVYLMGIARDQAELERVVALAYGRDGVREVVSHVRLRSEPAPVPVRPGEAPPPTAVGAVPAAGTPPAGNAPDGAAPATPPGAGGSLMPPSPPRTIEETPL